MNIRKAVFPVAGFGTHFLPATKAMPKELLPIVDKPLIQYAAEEAIAAGTHLNILSFDYIMQISREIFYSLQSMTHIT
jgi:UTP-glucose-1-phosphate uridylyltransferase